MSKTTDLLSHVTAKIEQIKKAMDDNLNVIKELEVLISQIQTEERYNSSEQANTALPIAKENTQSKPELPNASVVKPTKKAWTK